MPRSMNGSRMRPSNSDNKSIGSPTYLMQVENLTSHDSRLAPKPSHTAKGSRPFAGEVGRE